MPNPRVPRLEDQIQQLVASTLEHHVKDPRLGFVTVVDVHLTGDLRDATVFYTVMGDEQSREDTAQALESARGMIRSRVGKSLGIRHTPSLTFVLDQTPESAQHIEDALRRARDSDERLHDVAAGATYAGEEDPYHHKGEDDDLDDGEIGPGPSVGPDPRGLS